METERKLDVLADIARALNQSGVTWAVGGSLLLYFKGKTGVFRDIDLMVCETDVEKLKQAMLPLGAPAPSDPNAQYRTRCFLEFTVRGVDVDVMAGFVILENGQEHERIMERLNLVETELESSFLKGNRKIRRQRWRQMKRILLKKRKGQSEERERLLE